MEAKPMGNGPLAQSSENTETEMTVSNTEVFIYTHENGDTASGTVSDLARCALLGSLPEEQRAILARQFMLGQQEIRAESDSEEHTETDADDRAGEQSVAAKAVEAKKVSDSPRQKARQKPEERQEPGLERTAIQASKQSVSPKHTPTAKKPAATNLVEMLPGETANSTSKIGKRGGDIDREAPQKKAPAVTTTESRQAASQDRLSASQTRSEKLPRMASQTKSSDEEVLFLPAEPASEARSGRADRIGQLRSLEAKTAPAQALTLTENYEEFAHNSPAEEPWTYTEVVQIQDLDIGPEYIVFSEPYPETHTSEAAESSASAEYLDKVIETLSAVIEELAPDENEIINQILDKILLKIETAEALVTKHETGAAANPDITADGLKPGPTDGPEAKSGVESELEKLYIQLLNYLEIDYTSALIESIVRLTLRQQPGLTAGLKAKEDIFSRDPGTHEIINHLQNTVSGLKLTIPGIYDIGRTAVRLYKIKPGLAM